MDGKLDIFQAITRRMSWLGQRQNVLARNIANADTPDYRPHDLSSGPFERILSRAIAAVQPAATHPAHMRGGAGTAGRDADISKQRDVYETAPSGNAVVLEEQLIRVAETQMDYQTMTSLYRKHLQMLRTALGRGES